MATFKCAGRKRKNDEGEAFCDYSASRRWLGKCPGCGRFYNCEKIGGDKKGSQTTLGSLSAFVPKPRISTGIAGLDYVLGGGPQKGSVVIISGPPGAGKSTLFLQAAKHMKHVVYASGEQKTDDIAEIAHRLGIVGEGGKDVHIHGLEGDIYKICTMIEEMEHKPKLLVIDSLQTANVDDCKADEGSAEMCRAVTNFITAWAKREGVIVFMVSHVNKEGDLAGPRAVEHLVDATVEFDLVKVFDEDGSVIEKKTHRVLRSGDKSRLGASGLEARFKMTDKGLVPFKQRTEKDEKLLTLLRGGKSDDDDDDDLVDEDPQPSA